MRSPRQADGFQLPHTNCDGEINLVSSVSPERCETTLVYFFFCANSMQRKVSVTCQFD